MRGARRSRWEIWKNQRLFRKIVVDEENMRPKTTWWEFIGCYEWEWAANFSCSSLYQTHGWCIGVRCTITLNEKPNREPNPLNKIHLMRNRERDKGNKLRAGRGASWMSLSLFINFLLYSMWSFLFCLGGPLWFIYITFPPGCFSWWSVLCLANSQSTF